MHFVDNVAHKTGFLAIRDCEGRDSDGMVPTIGDGGATGYEQGDSDSKKGLMISCFG